MEVKALGSATRRFFYANPGLVTTFGEAADGSRRVRMIEIVGYDLQPCGHAVRRTADRHGTRERHRKEGHAEPQRAFGVR